MLKAQVLGHARPRVEECEWANDERRSCGQRNSICSQVDLLDALSDASTDMRQQFTKRTNTCRTCGFVPLGCQNDPEIVLKAAVDGIEQCEIDRSELQRHGAGAGQRSLSNVELLHHIGALDGASDGISGRERPLAPLDVSS